MIHSIFNFCSDNDGAGPCILAMKSTFIILVFRKLLFKKPVYSCLYYCILIIIIGVLAIVGCDVINDAYKRLEIFKKLELNNRLEYAKANPSTYDSMLQIDLRQFANSQEFKDYIHNAYEINNEAMLIGLLFALIAELSHVCCLVYSRLKNLVYKVFVRNSINKDV